MILKDRLKKNFYDFVVVDGGKEFEKVDENGKYYLKVIVDDVTTISYEYPNRDSRNSDFTEITKVKRIINIHRN
jgi:hypothetical protein